MNRTTVLIAACLVMTGLAQAQTSAGVQGGASAQTQTGASAEANRSGLQGSGNASAATSANASANVGQQHASLADGTTMNAALSGTLDAKKSKVGDQVVARTSQDVKQDGKVVVPKGTRLIGHVTQVQARGKESAQSSLGVVFERAELRNGEQVPLNAGIQALAVSQAAAQTSAAGDDLAAGGGVSSVGGGRASGGGGLVGGTARASTGTLTNVAGGVGSTAGGAVNATAGAATRSTGAVGGLNSSGVLTSSSQGVFGMQGLSLDAAASNATQGSVIVSKTENVHLASDTQMLLRVGASH